MAKDPAFLFYPNDYIGGTMGMTFEEKGAYMELLMTQFNRGHMTSHMIGQVVGQIWDKLQDKFEKDENGLWFNRRLEEEKLKRMNFTKSRNNNRSGNNQHTKNEEKKDKKKSNHMSGHMTSHMENENVNNIVNKNTDNIESNNLDKSEKNILINSNLFRKPNIPTHEEVLFAFKQNGGTEEMANRFYEKNEALEWMISNSPIRNFRKLIPGFISAWEKNQSKNKDNYQKSASSDYKVFTPREDW